MDRSRKQFLKVRGWPEPSLAEIDKLTDPVREKAENYLNAVLEERAQVVLVTGQNNFYKDAVVGTIMIQALTGMHYVHAPTLDILPENGHYYYFARFDNPMDFKQAYHVRNQVFKIVARGGIAFLGVNSAETLANIHTDGFQREYNSVMKVLNVASMASKIQGTNI